jgi:hypothetical protein
LRWRFENKQPAMRRRVSEIVMKPQDFVRLGRGIHRLSQCEIGATALHYAVQDFAEEVAKICAHDPQFDSRAFVSACALDGASAP